MSRNRQLAFKDPKGVMSKESQKDAAVILQMSAPRLINRVVEIMEKRIMSDDPDMQDSGIAIMDKFKASMVQTLPKKMEVSDHGAISDDFLKTMERVLGRKLLKEGRDYVVDANGDGGASTGRKGRKALAKGGEALGSPTGMDVGAASVRLPNGPWSEGSGYARDDSQQTKGQGDDMGGEGL